jgi:hypothetical protein
MHTTRRTFLATSAAACGLAAGGSATAAAVPGTQPARYAQLTHAGADRTREAVAASVDRLVEAAGRPEIVRTTMLGEPVRGGRYPQDFVITLHGAQGEQLVLTTHDDGGPELVVRT